MSNRRMSFIIKDLVYVIVVHILSSAPVYIGP
nr:MAG TPA: hypothetical protein [Caudoviricetes sp.]